MNRPIYKETSLKDALKFNWRGCDWHLSEKMDGVWTVRDFDGSRVTGETMSDGRFFAFDILTADNQDVRQCAWFDRRTALIDCAARYGFRLVKQGIGAEFIEAVLRDGGEGIVAKSFNAPFGVDWFRVKRSETFDCRIEAKLRGAVLLSLNGEPAGKCPLRGANFEAAQVGDIIEVRAYRRNVSGAFREPVFLRFRADKKIQAIQNLSGNSISLTISL